MQNLVGLHILDGFHNDELLKMIGRLYDNGTPVPIVNVVNKWDLVHSIYERSPSTQIFARLENGHQPSVGDNGADWLDTRLPSLAPVLNLATVQTANEHNGNNPEFLSLFYCQMMERAKKIGVRCTVGDLAVGNPGGDLVAGMKALSPMLQMAQDLHFVVNVHMYGDQYDQVNLSTNSRYFFLRWVTWLESFPDLEIAGLEGGPFDARFVSIERTMSLIDQENVLLFPLRKNVKGLCQWTWGGTSSDGWDVSSIDSIQARYEAYVKSMGGQSTPSVQPQSPTLGEAEFIVDTQSLPTDTRISVELFDQPEPKKTYILTLQTIELGEDDVHPAPVQPEIWDVFTTSVLNVRQQASVSSTKVKIIAKDAKVSVFAADQATQDKNNGYVQLTDKSGWILYKYLTV